MAPARTKTGNSSPVERFRDAVQCFNNRCSIASIRELRVSASIRGKTRFDHFILSL